MQAGKVQGAIWSRQTNDGTFYSATFENRYKDDKGEWKSTDSYSLMDLLALKEAAHQAYTAIERCEPLIRPHRSANQVRRVESMTRSKQPFGDAVTVFDTADVKKIMREHPINDNDSPAMQSALAAVRRMDDQTTQVALDFIRTVAQAIRDGAPPYNADREFTTFQQVIIELVNGWPVYMYGYPLSSPFKREG